VAPDLGVQISNARLNIKRILEEENKNLIALKIANMLHICFLKASYSHKLKVMFISK
jgi:hypothetical protein